MAGATRFAWRSLLEQWSAEVLASSLAGEMRHLVTPTMVATRWLGHAGASELAIAEAERRLGTRLPPSYRSFLAVTDGWSVATHFAGLLLPAAEVGWLRDRDPGLVAVWGAADAMPVPDARYFDYSDRQDAALVRGEYFHTALEVSDPRYLDGERYLLNPRVVDGAGEWEAWFFANWLPGARRYRSFWELMRGERGAFLDLEARG